MTGLVLVFANLKERKLGGFPSNGMVLCAGTEETSFAFCRPPKDAKIGERVTLEDYDGFNQEKEKEIHTKKNKVLDTVFPEFKTDKEGFATYLGKKLLTSAGPVKADLPDAPIS